MSEEDEEDGEQEEVEGSGPLCCCSYCFCTNEVDLDEDTCDDCRAGVHRG